MAGTAVYGSLRLPGPGEGEVRPPPLAPSRASLSLRCIETISVGVRRYGQARPTGRADNTALSSHPNLPIRRERTAHNELW